MFTIDFNHPLHVHFIGIGGISMSGLAEILLKENFTISGSDMKPSSLTDHLADLGAQVFIGQKASNIDNQPDLVVYTAAISRDNPEFAAVIEKNIPILTRAELLGQVMKNYREAIAIAGTHGKTTTTSMISHVLLAAAKDPTISVGGILPVIKGNIRVGKSGTFITEACEYTNSYHSLFPTISVILNVDADHLDFFKDLDEIRQSFADFANKLPKDGHLIINSDIPNYQNLIQGHHFNVVSYGLESPADYTAKDIAFDGQGYPSFRCFCRGEDIGLFHLRVPGLHNVSNALATIALSHLLDIPSCEIQEGLLAFGGTDRRFQYKGRVAGVTIIDDYAHHPTEIKATLAAAKDRPHKKLWCVFQPHTYTRTKALLDDFAQVLSTADEVVLCDIYAAREKNTVGISSADLNEKILALGGSSRYIPSFDQIENFLLEHCSSGDMVITMGAGDVVLIGENLLGR